MKKEITGFINVRVPSLLEKKLIDLSDSTRLTKTFLILQAFEISLPILKKRYAKK